MSDYSDLSLRELGHKHHRRWMNYIGGVGPGDGRLVVTPTQRRRIKHKLGHLAAIERSQQPRKASR